MTYSINVQTVVGELARLLAGKDAKAAAVAATALGHLALSDDESAVPEAAADALLGASAAKSETLQFAVGEALCFVFAGTYD